MKNDSVIVNGSYLPVFSLSYALPIAVFKEYEDARQRQTTQTPSNNSKAPPTEIFETLAT